MGLFGAPTVSVALIGASVETLLGLFGASVDDASVGLFGASVDDASVGLFGASVGMSVGLFGA